MANYDIPAHLYWMKDFLTDQSVAYGKKGKYVIIKNDMLSFSLFLNSQLLKTTQNILDIKRFVHNYDLYVDENTPEESVVDTKIKRFTAFRKNLSERGTHTSEQANPDSMPQYEGVIWSDGTVTLRWLTAAASTSVWKNLQEMLLIHGHPEYGTEIIWHDGEEPEEWSKLVAKFKESQNGNP